MFALVKTLKCSIWKDKNICLSGLVTCLDYEFIMPGEKKTDGTVKFFFALTGRYQPAVFC